MVAYHFNANQYQPQYGGAGGLPPGKFKGVIANHTAETTQDNQGGYIALHLTPIEGSLQGQVQVDRLNLHNKSAKAVEIANKQLSAYCHVLGKFQFDDFSELHNIPFIFEIGWQKGEEPSETKPQGGYTEVKRIFDINGNEPGKAGSGPAPQQQQGFAPPPPPQGFGADTGGQGQGNGQGGGNWGGQGQSPPPPPQQPQGGGTPWAGGGGAPAANAPWGQR
jgi:uncharacterized protein DUF669